MTDHNGIQASQHPKLADPHRHDHEAWVKARRAEIERDRKLRRELCFAALAASATCILIGIVLAYADFIDAGWLP